jgi:[ribosomal protein S5]-alanine N-acetyltransferase
MAPLMPPLRPFPRSLLSDGEVAIRPWHRREAAVLARMVADPGVVRFTYFERGFTESDARRWIAANRTHWDGGLARLAVVDAATDRPVGVIGMEVDWRRQSAELFYWLAARDRGHGLMTRALRLISDWALDEVGLDRLFLIIEPVNKASRAVARRAGYRREGLLRSYQPFKGGRADFECWSLLPEDRA